jgi:hypothetical protein
MNQIDKENFTMKYMLLMYANEAAVPKYTPEEYQEVSKAWFGFNKEIEAAGVSIAYNGLLSVNDATSVRVREGKTVVADGPFAETHEQLGGYYILDCKDLDEAVRWAAKIPSAEYGTIEVRPLWSQK